MTPLESLFVLEIHYHARLRAQGRSAADGDGIRASYALQCGYEGLIRAAGNVGPRDVDELRERFLRRADARDVTAARDSLVQILGVSSSGARG